MYDQSTHHTSICLVYTQPPKPWVPRSLCCWCWRSARPFSVATERISGHRTQDGVDRHNSWKKVAAGQSGHHGNKGRYIDHYCCLARVLGIPTAPQEIVSNDHAPDWWNGGG